MDSDNVCKLVFRNNEDDSEISITLYSHYTLIIGTDSGEGKTHFFKSLLADINDEYVSVFSDKGYNVYFADDSVILKGLLAIQDRSIIFIDDLLLFQDSIISALNKTTHLIVCITRNSSLNIPAPMCGLYTLKRSSLDGKMWFELGNAEKLRLLDKVIIPSTVVVEGGEGSAENKLLSRYFSDVRAAGGFGRVYRTVKHLCKYSKEDILVFADLGNMNGQYSL